MFLPPPPACGEPVWQLPMFPDVYDELIKSEVADIKNVGEGRWGGAITAAKFLEQFVDGKPWTHLDIAGPAFLRKAQTLARRRRQRLHGAHARGSGPPMAERPIKPPMASAVKRAVQMVTRFVRQTADTIRGFMGIQSATSIIASDFPRAVSSEFRFRSLGFLQLQFPSMRTLRWHIAPLPRHEARTRWPNLLSGVHNNSRVES